MRVCLQGGRWRRRQSGRRQQPTRHHLHRFQDVAEHCRQRQGRTHRQTHTRWALHPSGAVGGVELKQPIKTRSVVCNELTAHSCLAATGSPTQQQVAEAGAVNVTVARRLGVCTVAHMFCCVENHLCQIHRAPLLGVFDHLQFKCRWSVCVKHSAMPAFDQRIRQRWKTSSVCVQASVPTPPTSRSLTSK